MPELMFAVEGVQPLAQAASPHLVFRLHIRSSGADEIQSVLLQCQIRIEPALRRYDRDEERGVFDLFGDTQRWGESMRSMLWTHCSVTVPGFVGETSVALPVSCTYDFNLGATKYFDALHDGEVPLTLLFSGTIFYHHAGILRIAPIAWDKEASFRLPVQTWRQMMDQYYPNVAWLCLRKDIFERLHRYKSRLAAPTWEQAIAALLTKAEEE
jgi:hypothetical protein